MESLAQVVTVNGAGIFGSLHEKKSPHDRSEPSSSTREGKMMILSRILFASCFALSLCCFSSNLLAETVQDWKVGTSNTFTNVVTNTPHPTQIKFKNDGPSTVSVVLNFSSTESSFPTEVPSGSEITLTAGANQVILSVDVALVPASGSASGTIKY